VCHIRAVLDKAHLDRQLAVAESRPLGRARDVIVIVELAAVALEMRTRTRRGHAKRAKLRGR
jgi:hypothetical protein